MRTNGSKTVFGDARPKVTIRQLARLSGVSVGTVSRALNGYTDVNPETRERIMRLARELDYTPAAAARSLVTQRSHVIGVFLETGEGHPDLQHPFFHEVLVGLKHEIGAARATTCCCSPPSAPATATATTRYLKRCRHHNVEGVVLMGVDPEDPEVRRLAALRAAVRRRRRRARAARRTELRDLRQRGAARALAVDHLHELGHRRIATITGPARDARPGADRLRGYRDALQARGLAYRDEYVAYGDFYVESGRAARWPSCSPSTSRRPRSSPPRT